MDRTAFARTLRSWIARNLGPVGRLEQGADALRTIADVVADIPDLAQRLKRVIVRLDESGTGDAQRIERFARNERRRAVLQTAALWAIAVGALVLAFG